MTDKEREAVEALLDKIDRNEPLRLIRGKAAAVREVLAASKPVKPKPEAPLGIWCAELNIEFRNGVAWAVWAVDGGSFVRLATCPTLRDAIRIRDAVAWIASQLEGPSIDEQFETAAVREVLVASPSPQIPMIAEDAKKWIAGLPHADPSDIAILLQEWRIREEPPWLPDLCAIFGWQGGTWTQVHAKLQGLIDAAEEACDDIVAMGESQWSYGLRKALDALKEDR